MGSPGEPGPVLKVALTGGIATGKSYILDRCRARGIPCLDADELAHGVMVPGSEATLAIADRFGDVLDADGGVDRRRLGALVFADADARRDLEALVHPAVYRAIEAGLRAFQRLDNPPLAVVAIPLLFETGHAGDFDAVIATTCPLAIQRARLARRGLSDAEIDQRLAAQLPSAEKSRRAHHVIETGGSFEETDAQLETLLKQLLVRT